jgi:hypothetical protein
VVHRFGGRSVATGKVWRGGDLLEVGEVGGRNGKTRSPLANRSGLHCFEAQLVPPLPPMHWVSTECARRNFALH